MNNTVIIIDRLHNTLEVQHEELKYFESNVEEFCTQIGFLDAFPDTTIMHYAPLRNIYVAERLGGATYNGDESEEAQWIRSNFDNIVAIATEKKQLQQLEYECTVRMVRDVKLNESDWLVTRHYEQLIMNVTPSLSNTQLQELHTWRQALRDMQNLDDVYNENVQWPATPSFMS